MPSYDAEVSQAIARWAPVFGVKIDPAWVHAILEQESRHGAASNYVKNGGRVPEPGGRYSVGPMQVLESTARELGASDPRDLINPMVGISYGVKYFAGMLKRFKGDAVSAISAYNAGPGGVGKNPGYIEAVLGFLTKYRQAAPVDFSNVKSGGSSSAAPGKPSGSATPVVLILALVVVVALLGARRRAA